MGLFSKILDKLGFKKDATQAKDTKPAASSRPAPGRPVARPTASAKPVPATPGATPPPAPMEMVDVMSKLEKMAAGSGLNWKVSIVDLLKVLDIDSSLAARKELAEELGCPAETMKDNVAMNVWLHKAVLSKIAKNGGNIPKELLD